MIDLIEAETAQAARNAVEQLGGALRGRVEPIYERLLDVASQFYAVVDYPDDTWAERACISWMGLVPMPSP